MRTALVTGATGGIGSAVAEAMIDKGYLILAPTRKDLDVTNETDVATYCSRTKYDTLILCHAAKIGCGLEEQLNIDVKASWSFISCSLVFWRLNNFGRIVLFSSIRAHHPRPGQVAYATAKAATEGMTRALAVEYGRYGITVNCIAPGAVDTPRTRANVAAGIVSEQELINRTPNGRLATVDDVCNTVLWLVSDGAAHVNGQVITVDGGWSVNG